MDKTQTETWKNNFNAILEAVINIEARLEDPTFSEIKRELIRNKKNLSDPTISKHLKFAKHKGELVQKGRVYSRKFRLYIEDLYNSITVSESFSKIRLLENDAFTEYLDQQTPTINQMIKEYEKKCENKFTGWRYKQKLEQLRLTKSQVQFYIRKKLTKELNYIRKATEVKVLSSKKLHNLDFYKLGNVFAEMLLRVLHQERYLAEAEGRKFSMEDFGLGIKLSFNPKKAGKPPKCSTILELIDQQKKHDVTCFSDSSGLWDNMKKTELKHLENIKDFEKVADELNLGDWDVPCPQHFGYLAEKPIGTEIPKDCLNCPKYEECWKKQK